jgi:hypothetical protein
MGGMRSSSCRVAGSGAGVSVMGVVSGILVEDLLNLGLDFLHTVECV